MFTLQFICGGVIEHGIDSLLSRRVFPQHRRYPSNIDCLWTIPAYKNEVRRPVINKYVLQASGGRNAPHVPTYCYCSYEHPFILIIYFIAPAPNRKYRHMSPSVISNSAFLREYCHLIVQNEMKKKRKLKTKVNNLRPAMSNPRPSGRMRPRRRFCAAQFRFFTVVKVSYILTTCPYFDNLEFDIIFAGGPQCHFITSVTIAVRMRTLSGH